MLKNYFLVAVRGIRRHPLYALLNVAGLAVGIAACLLIILFVQDELSYDRMHRLADRTYRIVETRAASDGSTQDFVYTMGPLAAEMSRALPEVERTVRAVSRWSAGRAVVQRGDVRFYVGDQLFVEPAFFEIFDFEFTAGRPNGALDEPLEVVLSEAAAARYFGSEDPIGKSLTVEGPGEFTVTGVVRLPSNTHIHYSLFFSFATLLSFEEWRSWLDDDWSSNGIATYVVVQPGTDVDAVDARMRELVEQRAENQVAAARRPYLQAVTDIHLGSTHIDFDEHASPGRPVYLYLFGAVAAFVVLIAAMNYMNMSTARSMRRSLEIGMRKVVGARRRQLVFQFLTESVLTTGIALAGALVLARGMLPLFNDFTGKALSLSVSGPIVTGALVLVGVVGLLAGAYPAFYLSQFRPAAVLRGRGRRPPGRSPVRKGLVVVQFVMSISLIIAALVVHDQLRYVQTKDLGFEEDQLVVVDINDGRVRAQFDAVVQEFSAVPGVEAVAVSNSVPGDWKNITQVEAGRSGSQELVSTSFFGIDERFLDAYDIELLEGRNFRGGSAADSTSLLLNESAARMLNVSIGDRVEVPDEEYTAVVVGIVDDFHFRSLHQTIGPLLLGYRANPIDVIDYFTVRLSAADVSRAIEGLRAVGERFDPDHPFELNVLDQRLAEFYTREERVRQVFGAAALLAVLVACMGLFGLAAYTAEQRTKEIGIRKVLGATASSIAALLTTEFAKLVLAAFMVSAPLTYLAMRWWLNDFAYRASIGADTILLAGAAALVLAVATVSYQAVRAALADPVKSLRYE